MKYTLANIEMNFLKIFERFTEKFFPEYKDKLLKPKIIIKHNKNYVGIYSPKTNTISINDYVVGNNEYLLSTLYHEFLHYYDFQLMLIRCCKKANFNENLFYDILYYELLIHNEDESHNAWWLNEKDRINNTIGKEFIFRYSLFKRNCKSEVIFYIGCVEKNGVFNCFCSRTPISKKSEELQKLKKHLDSNNIFIFSSNSMLCSLIEELNVNTKRKRYSIVTTNTEDKNLKSLYNLIKQHENN